MASNGVRTWPDVLGHEDAVHGLRALGQHGSELFAVDRLCDRGAPMSDETGDLLQGDPGLGQDRDEAVPQLAGRPRVIVEPSSAYDASEGTPDVGRIQREPRSAAEDQVVVCPAVTCHTPAAVLLLLVACERLDRDSWEAKRPP